MVPPGVVEVEGLLAEVPGPRGRTGPGAGQGELAAGGEDQGAVRHLRVVEELGAEEAAQDPGQLQAGQEGGEPGAGSAWGVHRRPHNATRSSLWSLFGSHPLLVW